VKVENEVIDIFIAQRSLESGHDVASPGQDRRAHDFVGCRSSTGKRPAIENTVQIGRLPFEVGSPPSMATAAMHLEEKIAARDRLGAAAFQVKAAA